MPLELLDIALIPEQLGTHGRWLWCALGSLLLDRRRLGTADRDAFHQLCTKFEVLWLGWFAANHVDYEDPNGAEITEDLVAKFEAEVDGAAREFGVTLATIRQLEASSAPWRRPDQA